MNANPQYKDAFAVVAGLERNADELLTLAGEFLEAAIVVRRAVRSGEPKPEALDHLHRQLVWLTGDVERMIAALRRDKEAPHAR